MASLFSSRKTTPHPPAPVGAGEGPAMPLQGPGLRIRPLQRPDLDRRQSWVPFRDPLRLIWDMPRCGRRENDTWFTQMTDGCHRLAYGVEDAAGDLIGMISLREIAWGRSARLGIAFSSQHVDLGLGTAALRLFLPYFFLAQRFQKMVLDVAAANGRAVRCYEKVGFRRVGSFWQPLEGGLAPQVLERPEYAALRPFFRWTRGQPETLHYEMELTRQDWAAQAREGP